MGATCYMHIPKEKRIKLDDNAHSAIFLGYAGTNQYRVWDLIREDVVVSRDVVFDESWRNWKDSEPIEHDATIPGEPSPKKPTAVQSDDESSSESSDESDDEQDKEPRQRQS